jgi:hypothetical protein
MTIREEVYKNTGQVIDMAIKRGLELGIVDYVFASCSGKTAEIFIDRVSSFMDEDLSVATDQDNSKNKSTALNLVCVTHQIGFKEPNHDEMPEDMRQKLETGGVKLLTTMHLLAGIDRALRFQFKGVYPSEIVSTALRMFGQGLKVCVEISVMAADAGLIRSGKDIIALGGSGIGADAAAVINPAHSQDFFKTKIREVICKPF